MKKLENKRCLVTGAARGIGEAIARAMASEGAEVIVTDINEADGRRVADEINGRFEYLNVAEESDWARMEDTIPALDVLVNNAGITGFESGDMVHDPENASLAAWRDVSTALILTASFLVAVTPSEQCAPKAPDQLSIYRRVRAWWAFLAPPPMRHRKPQFAITQRAWRFIAPNRGSTFAAIRSIPQPF